MQELKKELKRKSKNELISMIAALLYQLHQIEQAAESAVKETENVQVQETQTPN